MRYLILLAMVAGGSSAFATEMVRCISPNKQIELHFDSGATGIGNYGAAEAADDAVLFPNLPGSELGTNKYVLFNYSDVQTLPNTLNIISIFERIENSPARTGVIDPGLPIPPTVSTRKFKIENLRNDSLGMQAMALINQMGGIENLEFRCEATPWNSPLE